MVKRRQGNLMAMVAAATSIAFAFVAGESSAHESSAEGARRHFEEVLAPLLARRCLECHNPAERKGGLDLTSAGAAMSGGDSGPAIERGQPDHSVLWNRIEAGEMPPKHPLAPNEQKSIREWIAAGAVWGNGPIDRFRYTTDVRAGYDWWSLQKLTRPAVPENAAESWPRTVIDRFVLAELRERGLHPSPEADRRTLIRRLTFDLIGLPPTPEEIAAFVDDPAADAYERLVDRLLESPQYGVRWARHWLDIVRFGESNGFEYDEFRSNAWPYRDWVVAALNDDLAFDEFARLQIAGDAMRPGELDAAIATGFLAAGAYDTAGQNQQSAAMRAVVRQDELEDLVGTVAQTFLGLTVNCARCHDHKFDPIRQREYYSLVAALAGARQAECDVTALVPGPARARQLAIAESRQRALLNELTALEQPARDAILADGAAKPVDLRPLVTWNFDRGREEQPPGWEVALHGGARLTPDGLVLAEETAYATSPSLPKELRAKTLEVWVRLANVEQRGGAAMSVQSLSGSVFDAVVFGERDPGQWLAGSDNFSRTQGFSGLVETAVGDNAVHFCISYADDGTVAAYRDGRPYGQPYRASGRATFAAGQSQVVFGLRHSPAAPGKMLFGTIQRARLYDRALTADEVAGASGRYATAAMIRARLAAEQRSRYDQIQAQLAEIAIDIATVRPTRIYAVKPEQAETTRLLKRGNSAQPKEVVAAGGIGSLDGLKASFDLDAGAPEADCRRRLAEWVTEPHNPLFARVIANRLWQYHFGIGIVDTPNDFGFNGGRPTNQRLLDWLAAELIKQGYHLKAMHRLMVSSAVYRQSARPNAAAHKVDADNRLLWRKTPQRLEAEAVRDTMLHVAGVLDLSLGGPGFQEMKISIAPGTNTFLYAADDPTRAVFKRRTLFRAWARSGRSPLLDVLDCPDPSTTAPRRAVTTTPLQALALLNNAFVLHATDKFAERIAREAGSDPDRQVMRAFQLAYGREPSADEKSLASRIVREHGAGVLARSLFNSNEFVYVD